MPKLIAAKLWYLKIDITYSIVEMEKERLNQPPYLSLPLFHQKMMSSTPAYLTSHAALESVSDWKTFVFTIQPVKKQHITLHSANIPYFRIVFGHHAPDPPRMEFLRHARWLAAPLQQL